MSYTRWNKSYLVYFSLVSCKTSNHSELSRLFEIWFCDQNLNLSYTRKVTLVLPKRLSFLNVVVIFMFLQVTEKKLQRRLYQCRSKQHVMCGWPWNLRWGEWKLRQTQCTNVPTYVHLQTFSLASTITCHFYTDFKFWSPVYWRHTRCTYIGTYMYCIIAKISRAKLVTKWSQ